MELEIAVFEIAAAVIGDQCLGGVALEITDCEIRAK